MEKTEHGAQVLYGRECIADFAERADMSKEEARGTVELLFRMLTEAMSGNTAVCFRNFGTFYIRPTSERPARNPKTMEECMIPAGYKPEFRPSRYFRDTINRNIKNNEETEEELQK